VTSTCSPEPLARGGVGSVEFCRDCQVLHVTLGAVSLRFTPAGFTELCLLLGVALRRLRQHENEDVSEEADVNTGSSDGYQMH
jgi:hypothetical protein